VRSWVPPFGHGAVSLARRRSVDGVEVVAGTDEFIKVIECILDNELEGVGALFLDVNADYLIETGPTISFCRTARPAIKIQEAHTLNLGTCAPLSVPPLGLEPR
jgi:hypothetical protein